MEPNQNYTIVQQPTPDGEHVTTGGWLGRIILTCIPVVGIIMLFVWAFGNTPQKSLQTWARAQLIFLLILTAVIFFFAVVGSAGILEYIAYAV